MRSSHGLFDLQVNGYAGVDFNSDALTSEALDHALEAMLRAGVTGCLPTLITASEHALSQRLAALDRAVANSRLGPSMVPGYHIEGPFLRGQAGYAGCHPKVAMCDPDPNLIWRLSRLASRPILLVTLAPERQGSAAAIAELVTGGIVVAIAHSAANYEEVGSAAAAGMSLSTHLGNGLPMQLPKLENTLLAQLSEQRLTACFIADGHHLSPDALRALVSLKGVGRSVLVTDAVVAAAAPPGQYSFAGMKVELDHEGVVRVPGQSNLAGSALELDQAVRNVVNWHVASFEQACAMASLQARAAVGRAVEYHNLSLPPGKVQWDARMRVRVAELGRIRVVLDDLG